MEAGFTETNEQPGTRVGQRLRVVDGMPAKMTGAAIQALAKHPSIASIVLDSPVGSTTSSRPDVSGMASYQLWPDASQVSSFYGFSTEPTIAW